MFKALYRSAREIRLTWQKIKVLELLVLSQMEVRREKHLTDDPERRFSIGSLSRQCLMNSIPMHGAKGGNPFRQLCLQPGARFLPCGVYKYGIDAFQVAGP